MSKVWKAAVWNGRPLPYEVSDTGLVRSVKHPDRLLTPFTRPGGYIQYTITVNGKRYTRLAHALVAQAFLGPRPAGHVVNHIDGCPPNNAMENLEYCTHLENVRHAWRTGLIRPEHTPRGTRHPLHKLTASDVRTIKQRLQQVGVNCSAIARDFNVSSDLVFNIRNGKAWAHI